MFSNTSQIQTTATGSDPKVHTLLVENSLEALERVSVPLHQMKNFSFTDLRRCYRLNVCPLLQIHMLKP